MMVPLRIVVFIAQPALLWKIWKNLYFLYRRKPLNLESKVGKAILEAENQKSKISIK